MAGFNGKYIKEKELGKIGENMTVEIGHYEDGDKSYGSKVYVFNHYVKKDGTNCSQSVAKFSMDEAKEFAKIISTVE